MIADNPIILKELIQSAHRRRTYLLRTGLPTAACIILGIPLLSVLKRSGQDWRAIALAAKPMFTASMWMLLIALPIIAMSEAQTSLRQEWDRHTMDLLCATPLSLGQIMLGKLLSVLGKALVMGLALLPVMGIWLHMGRVPTTLVMACLGVIVATTFMAGSLGMMSNATIKPGKRGSGIVLRLLVSAYFGGIFLLARLVWIDHPVLVAAIPPWAFYYVALGTAPRAMSPNLFALLAILLPLGAGGAATAASIKLFKWRYARNIGGPGRRAKRRTRLPKPIQSLLGTRPELGPQENPFLWQEKGPPTRTMRWGLFIVYAIVLFVLVMISIFADIRDFEATRVLRESGFYLFLAAIGAGYVTLTATLYSVNVFAREKVRKTAAALVLTGNHPRRIYWAKILAAYRALWPAYAALACCVLIASLLHDRRDYSDVYEMALVFAIWAVAGPASGMVLGMAFSAAAKKPADALAAIILTPILTQIFSGFLMIPGIFLMSLSGLYMINSLAEAFVIIAIIAAFIRFTRRWSVWRMMVALAMILMLLMCIGRTAAMSMMEFADVPVFLGIVLGGAAWLAFVGFWYWLGIKTFDDCMVQGA